MPTLHWIGKDKIVNHHQDVPYKILEKQYTYSNGEQSKEGNSENKIIHGDNLEALKSLLPEYEGRIDCIYIDPPYNTGNEGWVYNDNVSHPKLKKWLGEVVGKESEDLTRHDKWLCMMYPRLKLLHKLLSKNGAIFISIDENEQPHLQLIMKEIFGVGNFVTEIIWNKRVSPARDAKFFSSDHEYIICYAKSINSLSLNRLPRTDKQNSYYKNPDNDPRGPWNSAAYTCNKSIEERPNLYYPIIHPKTGKEVYPRKTAVWAYSQETHLQHIEEDLLYWGKDETSKAPRKKAFLSEVGGVLPRSVWNHQEVGSTQRATSEFQVVFNEGGFNYPKSISLIERILKIATSRESIVLDSFSGSGTTAHAVLNVNNSDDGKRKFILIEMEEYAEDITAERVKRVIKGYGKDSKETEGTGGDFNYYTLGKPIFLENDLLNEDVNLVEIHKYVWYSETRVEYTPQSEPYFLGKNEDTAYYFFYEKDQLTTLNESFLRSIKTKAEQYIVYADNCLLDKQLMDKYHIVFKKIPRDISRF